jgi:putative membrane protein
MPDLSKPERTVFAEDRTALANERTYSAWLRTGLGALAAGAAFEKLLGQQMPPIVVKGAATALIVGAVVMFWIGWWRYTHLGRRLRDADIRRIPEWTAVALALLLSAAALLVLAGGFVSAPSG